MRDERGKGRGQQCTGTVKDLCARDCRRGVNRRPGTISLIAGLNGNTTLVASSTGTWKVDDALARGGSRACVHTGLCAENYKPVVASRRHNGDSGVDKDAPGGNANQLLAVAYLACKSRL